MYVVNDACHRRGDQPTHHGILAHIGEVADCLNKTNQHLSMTDKTYSQQQNLKKILHG